MDFCPAKLSISINDSYDTQSVIVVKRIMIELMVEATRTFHMITVGHRVQMDGCQPGAVYLAETLQPSSSFDLDVFSSLFPLLCSYSVFSSFVVD